MYKYLVILISIVVSGCMPAHRSTITLYGADWCGACKALRPTLEAYTNCYDVDLVERDMDVVGDEVELDHYILYIPTIEFRVEGRLFYYGLANPASFDSLANQVEGHIERRADESKCE